MARRAAWQKRLVRGSLGALLASVITLALGLPLWQQVGGLVAGFLLGLVLPVRGQLENALERIRHQSGLSYETALENALGPGPFGLADEVRQRARLTTRDVRHRNASPWWLPALAAAIALLLLPIAGIGGGNRASGPAATPPLSESGTPEPSGTAAPDVPPPPPAPPDRAQTPSNDAADAQQAGAAAGQAADQGREAGMTDQQTLSQYLQGLRERPPGDAGGGGADGADGTQGQDGNPNVPAHQRADAPTPGSQGARQDSAGQGEGQEPSTRAEEGEGAGQAERTGAAGADEQDEGGAQAATPGLGEEAADDGAAQATGEAGEEQAGNAEDGMQAGQRGVDEGAGAGNQPGEASGAEGTGLMSPVGKPEFLEGVLRPGPESRGGSIRLPGSTDVQLPSGTSADTYTRAAEQALTEGNVPLEYQEIIRRYFR